MQLVLVGLFGLGYKAPLIQLVEFFNLKKLLRDNK